MKQNIFVRNQNCNIVYIVWQEGWNDTVKYLCQRIMTTCLFNDSDIQLYISILTKYIHIVFKQIIFTFLLNEKHIQREMKMAVFQRQVRQNYQTRCIVGLNKILSTKDWWGKRQMLYSLCKTIYEDVWKKMKMFVCSCSSSLPQLNDLSTNSAIWHHFFFLYKFSSILFFSFFFFFFLSFAHIMRVKEPG